MSPSCALPTVAHMGTVWTILALLVTAGVGSMVAAWLHSDQRVGRTSRRQEHGRAGSAIEDLATAKRLLIVSASIGAGHDGAADELARRAVARGALVDRCDFLDLLPNGLGSIVRGLYHRQLKALPTSWGWLMAMLGQPACLRIVGGSAALLARRRLLAAVRSDTGLVVTTYPLASHAVGSLRLRRRLGCRALAFLTDMSVHPLWIAPGMDGHAALHELPAGEAHRRGACDVAVVGPAVDPRFHRSAPWQRIEARRKWGLPAETPLALIVAGSWGVGDITQAVADVNRTRRAIPVVVCGENARLHDSLVAAGVYAFGWVSDMATLMQACDLVVQNAGGLTSLEARASGLPVVTYRPLPGHGRTNAAALEQAGWATWARDVNDLTATLVGLLGTAQPAVPEVVTHAGELRLAVAP